MANIYLDSVTGDNADSGATQALAKATLAGCAAIDAAGDTIFVDGSGHNETTAGSIAYSSPGTVALPCRIISSDWAAEPPTALLAGAVIACTGSNVISFEGILYAYGLTINASSSTNYGLIYFGSTGGTHYIEMDTCKFRCIGTHQGSLIQIGRDSTGTGCLVSWKNCSVKFAAAATGINIVVARFTWSNGVNGGSAVGIEAGGTSPTYLFEYAGELGNSNSQRATQIIMDGIDLSNGAAGMHIANTLRGASQLLLRNCKLPASWTGSLVKNAMDESATARMVNCDNGSTNYRYKQQTKTGIISDEETIVMTGGATDGVTPISMKVVTNTNCGPGAWLKSQELYVENTTTGSAITVTVEIIHDSVTALDDDEIWLEVSAAGTSGQPLGVTVTDRVATALTTPAAQASSSETWTTTGMTNPNKQKLSVSITPQQAGFLTGIIKVAKVSQTVYFNPALIVT